MNTNVTRVPVLIVGAGAVGLAASDLLAKYGVSSLLIEKRREVFLYPKARNLSFRSLEILRGLGLSDRVHAVAGGVSTMVVKPTLNSADEAPAMDVDVIFAPFAGLSPEPPAQYCPQSRLEPMMLADTRRRGSRVRYATELVSFEQDDAGVTAVVRDRDSGETETVRADYLVAAARCRSLSYSATSRRRGGPSCRTCATATACRSRTPTWTGFSWWPRATWACSSPRTCRARVKRRHNSRRSGAPSCSPGPSENASTCRSSRSRRGSRTSGWQTNSLAD